MQNLGWVAGGLNYVARLRHVCGSGPAGISIFSLCNDTERTRFELFMTATNDLQLLASLFGSHRATAGLARLRATVPKETIPEDGGIVHISVYH